MTRALIVESAGNLWGSERALLDMLKAMSKMEAAVCCPAGTPLNGELAKLNVRILPYYVSGLHQKSRWHRLRAAIGVLRACLEFRPEVVYVNQGGSYKTVLPAAALLRLPIVAHVRIFEDAAYLARQKPNPRRLSAIIAISSAIEKEIRRFKDLSAIPLHRIYDAYTPLSEGQRALSTERVEKRISCVGRLVPIKGVDVLVRAVTVLKTVEPKLECLFAGSGDRLFVEMLKSIVAESACDSIRWLGFIHDVLPLLRSCSVLVCPSHSEPLGRVIFEAWDAGTIPVVFSGSGGAAEIVLAADGGILYKDQTPESLADAVRDALSLSNDNRARLVSNGRSWMAENCSLRLYGEALSTVIQRACCY